MAYYDEPNPWPIKKCLLFMSPLFIIVFLFIFGLFLVYPLEMLTISIGTIIGALALIGLYHLIERT